jgi:hypothetical protein
MGRLSILQKIMLSLILFFDLSGAVAQKLPGDSAQLLPVLNTEIDKFWPGLTPRSWLAAIPDQEANWKLKATLKTSRELGCGLGQFTIAYDAAGKVRFDALEETKRLDPSLKDWNWKDCYNAQYQLRGVVLKMRTNDRQCTPLMDGNRNVKACAGAAYNGGFGSVTKRIRLCRMNPECDPDEWYGHLDQQCAQSNVKVQGYGESFCMINSKYPGRVEARQGKFLPNWPGEKLLSLETKKETQ